MMTIRDLFPVRLLAGCAPILTLALAGCSQQQAGESAPVQPAVALAPQPIANGENGQGQPKLQPVAAVPQPEPPKPEPPAPTFAFPPDLTGKALPRVVAPDVSRPLPGEHTRPAPKPRTVPNKVLDPDASVRANYAPPPLVSPKPTAAKPVNPPEKVPVNFGAGEVPSARREGFDDVPAKPVLPVKPVVTERARDVNVPPPAPVLGRAASDRVSLDDPTGELGNAEVVAGVVKTPLGPSGFLKVSVPDPFELAEHVKPKVPQSSEPSAAPIPVNPQRVK